MKFGIKRRLILFFSLLIVIPLLVTFVSLGLTLMNIEGRFNEDPQYNLMEEVAQINQDITDTIQDNYPYISDYHKFQNVMKPFTEQVLTKIQVIDNNSMLLFDSQDQNASMKLADQALKERVQSVRENPTKATLFLYSLPIIIDGTEEALAFVWYNPSVAPFNEMTESIKGLALSLGAGIVSLILLIVLFTWYLSRLIIRPLNELNAATERIAQGDLAFNIHYNNNDELGIFAKSFESMRLQLMDSLEKQKVAENTRKEMIASISHDLRTPIASIKGYVEGLSDGVAEDKETVQRYLRVIRDKTEQLNRQIEDLFEFSQFDVGQLRLRMESVDSRDVLEKILQAFELHNQPEGPTLTIERPLSSVRISVDAQRIEQVMMNLLSNAFRYVPKNGSVRVRTLTDDAYITFAVEDNGPGIAHEDLGRIFDIFYRGEKSRSRGLGGTGLGLAICKHIVEAHGGKIWVESTEGMGSIFRFSIPVSGSAIVLG